MDSERIGDSTIVGEGWRGFIMVRSWRETARWKICDTKDSCGTVFSALRGLELRCRVVVRDGKDISGVNEVNESDTIIVVDGD